MTGTITMSTATGIIHGGTNRVQHTAMMNGMDTLQGIQLMLPSPGFNTSVLAGCMTDEQVISIPMDIGQASDDPVQEHASLDAFLAGVERKAYHVAYGALWDRETALDVVQDSMLRFVQYYREKAAPDRPALFRSVLNSRINDERRKRMLAEGKRKLLSLTGLHSFGEHEDDPQREADLPSASHAAGFSHPESDSVGMQLKLAIETALRTLPERQRQVFLLREQLGLSINETAETLGCSANSIKQHHFRALRALRVQLAEVWHYEHA
jgi:RNA polymerase sigma-70 factor (ECF subfamily)